MLQIRTDSAVREEHTVVMYKKVAVQVANKNGL